MISDRGGDRGLSSELETFPFRRVQEGEVTIPPGDFRKEHGVWDYSGCDHLNTDQMFAGNLTYKLNSAEAEALIPHLFEGFDRNFSKEAASGDIILAGENFGCGSSREHPAVGLAHLGIQAVIVKSVNRIFYRSAINQGLPVIVHPAAVKAYGRGDQVSIDFSGGRITVADETFSFEPLPGKLMEILQSKGLVNWIASRSSAD